MFAGVESLINCQQLVSPRQDVSCPSEAWWASQVVCAKAGCANEPTSDERFFKELIPLKGPPWQVLGKTAHDNITGYLEVRQPYCSLQPDNWITYHTFLLLEIASGESFLLCERKSDLLELVIGEASMSKMCVEGFRANGPGRNMQRCVEHARVELTVLVTVRQFFEWLDGPVEENWKPYDMLYSNCQHFVQEIKRFLHNPSMVWPGAPNISDFLPEDKQSRWNVCEAITADWRALKYAHKNFRSDRAVVFTALEQDGGALRYAHEELRKDRAVVLAALQQNGYALPFVDQNLLNDLEVVLTAVVQNGGVLGYASHNARRDKRVALAAVRSEAYAWRYVDPLIRWCPEVVFAATMQNPFAVARQALV